MVDFSKPPACYWSDRTKLEYMQRRVLVYSYMYYQMDVSVVSDYDYDTIAKQLAKMQAGMDPEVLKSTRYWYAFDDFDGNTGFHLSYRLKRPDFIEIGNIAHAVHSYWLSHTDPAQRQAILSTAQLAR